MTTTVHRRTPDRQIVQPETPFTDRIRGPVLAITRIATGLIFLWAFVDKTFGLGYATPGERAWIRGGSPTAGFLGGVDVGPFQSAFRALAGNPFLDWLFMIALLGIGVAVIMGAGLRIAAVAGSLMMILMWAAEWPPALLNAAGEATRSTNPIVDYHLIYALVLITLAVTGAGRFWGVGRRWERMVDRQHWLV
ncbi:DoxX family protein [Microlunatus sp. GCM10028923]|uniref:DoxX family protein n=1 Tax=Microlunatus sp. GCM10028923 TaxID=3273400 RepID=UPI00361DF805